jgi:hypothetical protein
MKTLICCALFLVFLVLATWEAVIKGDNPFAEDSDR